MDKRDMMAVKAKQATMWTLSTRPQDRAFGCAAAADRRLPQAIDVFMDFDAQSADAMIAATSGGRVAVLPRVVGWKAGAKSKPSASPCVDHSTCSRL